jgi:hypothetical protein
MKKTIAIFLIALLVLPLAACGTSSSSRNTVTSAPTTTQNYNRMTPPMTTTTAYYSSSSEGSAGFGASKNYPLTQAPPPVVITVPVTQADSAIPDRMIVRNGSLAIVVDNVSSVIEQISNMTARFNGVVLSSNLWQDREILYGSTSVRVPAERFDEAMKGIRDLATDITNETTNSQDVTQEYVDLSSQLKNLRATEAQLLKIMDKAEKVEDVLAVQRELTNVRGQIEQITGRMQYLERTSAMSLINVSLQQSKLNLDFNANKSVVKEREDTWFSASIAGGFAPYSYQWDLGDKTTSTEASFSHAYKNAGKYTVTLTVTDDHGNTISKTRTDYISVIAGWSAGSAASGAANGLAAFGRGLADMFIFLGVFSPVWITVGLIAGGIIWFRRNRKKTH